MFDQIGDYRIAFLILAGVAALGTAAALLAKQPSLAVKGGDLIISDTEDEGDLETIVLFMGAERT
ncbi:MAG TPA: hypothetical protein EYM39_07625 [Candidatus Latescibacteria bacterium]|nr:hypothetical protein [Candidatus Latescibacterota bacterium]